VHGASHIYGRQGLRTVVSAEELDGVDEARVERGRPAHPRRPGGALRRREPCAGGDAPGAPPCAGDVARLVEAGPAAHGAVLELVQRHAVGVVVQAAAPGRAGGAGVHGHRERQRERHGHGHGGQLQRRRHGTRAADSSVSTTTTGGSEEPGVEGGDVVVVVIMGRCSGGEADLEGEIRLGREKLH
jgi:hypothetical protein